MKRKLTLLVLFCTALSAYGQSRTVSLDDAISNSAIQIQDDLERGSKIIVYQFQSQSTRISDYILKELFNLLVNSRNFTVLDRTAQDVIDAELYFQFNQSAGMISDGSLASLTSRLGAKASITGSLDDIGTEYRFYIKAIGIETTEVPFSYAVSIPKNDKRIVALSSRAPDVWQKIGTGALNIAFGLGSYLEGDIFGGVTISAGYGIATLLFIIEATALDWDSPAVGVPATIGFTVAGLTAAYGFARPFIYNRSPNIAAVMDNIRPGIVYMPGESRPSFQLTYTIKF